MPQTAITTVCATPRVVRLARVFTAGSLSTWGLTGLADDAQLVVSELVTNAVKASVCRATVTVCLWTDGRGLLIEVQDSSPGIPVLVDPCPDEDGGRGLAVVAGLSHG